MKKLLVSTTIIALILANGVTTYQYKKDIEDYERKLKFQSKINTSRQIMIDEKNAKIDVLREVIQENKKQIKDNKSQISNLKQQLEKAQHDSESPSVSISRGESANQKVYFDVTAYTSGYESTGKNPSHPSYGITASGTKVKEGRTIACPPNYPFGTKMKIDTVGYRVCEDRGGAIKAGRLDLYISDLDESIEFGRKTLLVEILGE